MLKKAYFILISVLTLFIIVGCSNTQDSGTKTDSDGANNEVASENTNEYETKQNEFYFKENEAKLKAQNRNQCLTK